jgi:nucleoside 2-deoxyribosyltransferase
MAKLIYIAGPLFSQAERDFLIRMTEELSRATGLDPIADFFLPHRDAGDVGVLGTRVDIFSKDLIMLDKASIVVALLDGPDVDSGTAIEIGYAFAKRKKVFGLLTDFRAYSKRGKEPSKINNMVWGVCEKGQTIFRSLDEVAEAVKQHIAMDKREES